MNTKTKLTALIITTCLVVACSLGIIAWALAAANVGIGSKLSVTYEASPHVVCTASATYQKTTDASATPFQSGTINMNYGDTSGSRTLNASSTALVLNDTNTYVVFEFTFTNNNKMNTMGINITLTDNGVCSNMTRKYYFGDLSSSTIAQKESTIKSSGIENSALSTKSVTLKQNQTTRIYMLLEITPGTVANYNADSTNKFLFTLTSVEVDPNAVEKVSYLSRDWTGRVVNAIQNASSTTNNLNPRRDFVSDNQYQLPDNSFGDVLGIPEIGMFDLSISITNKVPTGSDNQVSVGTNSDSSTSAYIQSNTIADVIAYWSYFEVTSTRDRPLIGITFYSEATIISPENSTGLFASNLDSIAGSYDREYAGGIGYYYADVELLDISKVTNFSNMFASGSYETNITYPTNFPEEYK